MESREMAEKAGASRATFSGTAGSKGDYNTATDHVVKLGVITAFIVREFKSKTNP